MTRRRRRADRRPGFLNSAATIDVSQRPFGPIETVRRLVSELFTREHTDTLARRLVI